MSGGLSSFPFRLHLVLVKQGLTGRGLDTRADVPHHPGGLAPGPADESAACRASIWHQGRLFRKAKGGRGNGSRAEQGDVRDNRCCHRQQIVYQLNSQAMPLIRRSHLIAGPPRADTA